MDHPSQSIAQFFRPSKIPTGIYPLVAIIGLAVSGASYFAYHSAVGPELAWNRKNNPHPNLKIESHQTPKLWNPNGRFTEYWHR